MPAIVATDDYSFFAASPAGPYSTAVAVVTSDTDDLAKVSNAIYVGVSGDVKVDLPGASAIVFKAVPVGMLRIRAKRIYAAGTTATNLLALY
jgi:hypothetical protein